MLFSSSAVLHSSATFVKGGVASVEILGVKSVLRNSQCLAEALKMHEFSLSEIADGVLHVGIVHQAQNVVISHPRLLL